LNKISNKKIAIVHDWLVIDAGAEKVLRAILDIFPQADVFSLVDFLSDSDRQNVLIGKKATTTFIQKLPFAKKYFRNYLPLFPLAMRSINLDGYDVIISSSWAFAKNIRKNESQIHVCYCHTPIRYAWDMEDEYTDGLPFFKRLAVRATLSYIRKFDKKYSYVVDYFIANSLFVADRIKRIYGRDSIVIYPPVDVDSFGINTVKKNYYLSVSRLVGYKKVGLIVEAFAKMPDKNLIVIGDGDEYLNIKKVASSNVKLLGYQSRENIVGYMQEAKAFVFAAIEDFGIAPVEAMACGTPVVAYGAGGVLESVQDGISGVFFEEQSLDSICKAVEKFEKMGFDYLKIRERAEMFSLFKVQFLDFYSRLPDNV